MADRGTYAHGLDRGCAPRDGVAGRDNAVAESFFASLKNERWYPQSMPATRARARAEVAARIEVFYNRARPHSTLSYRTPAAAMEAFFARYSAEQPGSDKLAA